jgi:hypothetical protein
LGGFTNPSTSTGLAIYIYTYDEFYYRIDKVGVTTFTIAASADPTTTSSTTTTTTTTVYNPIVFTSVKASGKYKMFSMKSYYTFVITTTDVVYTTYSMILGFSSDFTVLTGTCVVTGLASGYGCTSSSSSNQIIITNFVSATTTANYAMSFTVNNVKNPGISFQSGVVSVTLKDSTGAIVDIGTYAYS